MTPGATKRLFHALARSDLAGARAAIGEGADVDASGPSGGETPLMRVRLCREPLPMLRLLLEAGADPSRTDLAGRTALHHLTLCGDPAAVEAVLATGLDPHRRDHSGQRALDFSLGVAAAGVVERLARAMAPLGVEDRTRLFHRHVQRGETEPALRLVKEGIRLGPLTAGAYPPLYLAARQGEAEVAAALLDAGAALEEACGPGETALLAAGRGGHVACVAELLARGADPGRADSAGQTALHAVAGSRLPSAKAIDVARQLIRAGADPSRRNLEGYWPRALARASGNRELAEALPALPGEPPIDAEAARFAAVELRSSGDVRLRWRPNDVVKPFALEEHLQRDEWSGRNLDAGELVARAGGLLRLPELAWFAPLLERMRRGEPVGYAELRAAAARRLAVVTFRAG